MVRFRPKKKFRPPAPSRGTQLRGMIGLGDMIHQRAVVRELMQRHDLWLETCLLDVHHDLIAKGLKTIKLPVRLHGQAKMQHEEQARGLTYDRTIRPPSLRLTYTAADIDRFGTILASMFGVLGLPVPAEPDFSLPIPREWRDALCELKHEHNWANDDHKPLMIYRPLSLRREWDSKTRNCDADAYAALFQSIREQFFVVSVSKLAPGVEWLIGPEQEADVKLHAGELTFPAMAALFAEADLVFSPAGFAPVLAQAVGTPSVTVYGGRECFRTTQAAGAHLAPSLGIDPIKPCACHVGNHNCDKRIDVEAAKEKIAAFVAEHVPRRPRTLIFGTTYVDTPERETLTRQWLDFHGRLNPRCDLLLVDSQSPLRDWAKPLTLYTTGMRGRRITHTTPAVYDRFVSHILPKRTSVKLNFGCGTNRLDGWENFDAELDISKPLPFPAEHADYIFSEHCVEHIGYFEALAFFKECFRVLRPGGVIRIAVPSIESVWRHGTPDYFRFAREWAPTEDARGAMHALLFEHGHRTAWTISLLMSSLYYAGFAVEERRPCFSTHAALQGVEGHGKVIGDAFNEIETIICEGTRVFCSPPVSNTTI